MDRVTSAITAALRHRQRGRRVPGRSLAALPFLIALGAACSRQDTLQSVESIAISEATLTDLLPDTGEIVWLSGKDGPVALDLAAGQAVRVETGIAGAVRPLGEVRGQLLALRDGELLGIHPDSARPYRLLQGVEAAVLTPSAGILLQSISDGEIVAAPLDDLRAGWGWGGVGSASTALAVSPEGDRIYQALEPGGPDERPRLLVRDLLSGRILKSIDLDEPIRLLAVTAAGELIRLGWGGDRSTATVSRMTWEEGELRAAWTSYVRPSASVDELGLAIAPDGHRIAVIGVNEEAGLTLLDGETGFTIADFDTPTRDALFDEQGRLYAVTDSAVLRLE